MSDELTPWEDINPAMALAKQHAPPLPSSVRLEPATSDHFRDELTACLALVVPSGMSEAARKEWLVVAWGTLRHLPSDLLSRGCKVARETCDHPSKIVPTIIRATEEEVDRRRENAREVVTYLPGPPPKRDVMEHRGEPMTEEETAELNGILEGLGAIARYRPDGSRYLIS